MCERESDVCVCVCVCVCVRVMCVEKETEDGKPCNKGNSKILQSRRILQSRKN